MKCKCGYERNEQNEANHRWCNRKVLNTGDDVLESFSYDTDNQKVLAALIKERNALQKLEEVEFNYQQLAERYKEELIRSERLETKLKIEMEEYELVRLGFNQLDENMAEAEEEILRLQKQNELFRLTINAENDRLKRNEELEKRVEELGTANNAMIGMYQRAENEITILNNELILAKAETDGIGSCLLEVQQDCVDLRIKHNNTEFLENILELLEGQNLLAGATTARYFIREKLKELTK